MYKYAFYSRKLQKELGWKPSLQFEEGIEETVSKSPLARMAVPI